MSKIILLISFFAALTLSAGEDLDEYRQPDDVLDGKYDNYDSSNGNLCTRNCDGTPKICYWEIHVELYSAMGPACGNCSSNVTACSDPQCVTADGVERGITTYNRRFPGPSIQVCKGDTVVVDVHNDLADGDTTIHWHGIRQMETPFSDGVPKVTQCPITSGNQFRYFFKVSEAGTFFYHSHQGLQKVDGLSGPLIVRDNKENELFGNLYDFDLPSHVVFVNDWMHVDANEKFPGLHSPGQEERPVSYLINGRGIYAETGTKLEDVASRPPFTEFRVQQGKRYRFRLVGSTCLACTVQVTIFNHRVSIINADGAGRVVPTPVDIIVLNSGDRFDFILEANGTVDSYWIVARGNIACNNAQQFAILRYEGHNGPPSAPYPGDMDFPKGVVLNPSNSFCNSTDEVCLDQLRSPTPMSEILPANPKYRETALIDFAFYFFDYDDLFRSNTYQRYYEPESPQCVKSLINNISNTFPPTPLLTQYEDIPKDVFCQPECFEPIEKACTCVYVIKFKLDTLVTMIVSDTGEAYSRTTGLQHPFHLHGYNFFILEVGVFSGSFVDGINELKRRVANGEINNEYAIQKDTVGIMSGGYAVVQFYTDNPGFWFLHCHFAYHLDSGMSAVVQVGDLCDMVSAPPGFPKCNDFKPEISQPLP